MPTYKKFPDFSLTTAPANADFVVGYKADASEEQRVTVGDLLSASLASKGVRLLGNQSVAIGDGNLAAQNSLAIGDANAVQGLNSLAQGDSNQVTGLWSTAMGGGNKVTGDVSFAQGDSNQATGEASFAQGTYNIAEGTDSQAQGYGNIASGINSHAQGYNNCTGGYVAGGIAYGGAHAQGGYNIVAIPLAHAQGFANKIGRYEYADWYANNPPRLGFAFSGTTTLSTLNVYGLNNPALSSSVRLFFTSDNGVTTYSAYVSCTQADYNDPFGGATGFTIFLRNDASAVLSPDDYFGPSIMCVPITAYDQSTSFSNIGVGAFAQGYNNLVAGNYASAQGGNNVAAGFASHAAGYGSSTGPNAINAFAHGGSCIAYGRYSHAMGIKAYAMHDHSYVWNSDPNVTGDYFNSSLSGQYNVNAPGGIVLSGGNTSVEGLVVNNGGNLITRWGPPYHYIDNLSASSVLGVGNSAVKFNLNSFNAFNYCNDINGIVNTVNGSFNKVNGAGNALFSHSSTVDGQGNILVNQVGSVEGLGNIVGRVYTIAKTVSATNTIYFYDYDTPAPAIGSKIVIESGSYSSSIGNSSLKRAVFTVTDLPGPALHNGVTVAEPLTSLPNYYDDIPQSRIAVVYSPYATGNVSQQNASHAEGMWNYAIGRTSHAENRNNVALGAISHAEGEGTFAYTWGHAEGLETRAGMAGMYFDSYDANTNTFQLFTNSLSAWNTWNAVDIVNLGTTISLYCINTFGYNSSANRRSLVKFTVLSADANLNTVTAVSGVFVNSIPTGGANLDRQRQLLYPLGGTAHSQGSNTFAHGGTSHAEGYGTIAKGNTSRAAGTKGYAEHDYSSIWSSGNTTDALGPICTTRNGQYMVSAHGGMFLPGNVGIGTDSIANALTVAGTISATTITADNIAYTNAGFTNLPTYKTYQTNVAVKNANWPAVSAAQLAETDYFNSGATYAMPGALILKGHSPAYNNTIQNLPGAGTYGLWMQNVNDMDPGSTLISDGRAAVTHAMAFRAGINNFTGGSDHNHVQWQGAPFNPTQSWQMTNGGSLNVYGYGANTYTQRFMVHTLPQYQNSTTITAISGIFDTTKANLITDTDRLSGVIILLDAYSAPVNYDLITPGSVVGIVLNPGLAGLVAVTYNSQCTQVSSNATGTLTAYKFDFFIGSNTNWVPASRGTQAINLKSRTNGGNPGINLITSQIGTNPSTQYVGITGSYRGMNKHALARFTTANILTAYKPGSPLTLWIPTAMPSTSPIGTGFITSDKITTFAQGTFPSGVRTGYFDAFVVNVSGTDMEFALCNLMGSYDFENRTWPGVNAVGNAGWVLYGGTQDTVHRPTFGTTGFYFEREPYYFNSANNYDYLSGGMVKCVGLGTSEVYGDYSYGLGYRGAVLGKKSGTFAGDYNAVYGDNSVALGGSNLISISSNQVVMGTFNNPNTNSLFVVGSGASDTNRKNVFEIRPDGSVAVSSSALSSNGVDTFLKITGNGTNYGIKLQLI